MLFQSIQEFSRLEKILHNAKDGTSIRELDAILDDPVALTSIFSLACYLKINLPYNDLQELNLDRNGEREFLRYYLMGLSIVVMELKTHNCCGIQHKFMKLFKHTLVEAAEKKDYTFVEAVLNS